MVERNKWEFTVLLSTPQSRALLPVKLCIYVITSSRELKCFLFFMFNPAGIYLLKVNNRNTRARYKICSKLITKTPERRRRRPGVFIVNFEHISHLILVFLLLTLNKYLPAERQPCECINAKIKFKNCFQKILFLRRFFMKSFGKEEREMTTSTVKSAFSMKILS